MIRKTDDSSTFSVIFWLVIASYLACVVAVVFGVWLLIVSASSLDWSHGLKPQLEKIWCGAPGCTDKP